MGSISYTVRHRSAWTHEPHNSKCSGFDALYHADYRWAVSFSIFTCKVGRCVYDGAVGYAGCLIAKRAAAGWVGALALPLAMYGIRTAIPATSHWNVVKYANMVSLLQTNELLGNYRNLFWFGNPVSLPLVEWLTAAVLGGSLFAAFCAVFAKAQLLSAAKRSLALPFRHKTHATSVTREEGRKLLLMNGAAVFLAAFLAFSIYQA